jgi:carboxylesterase type B
VVVAPTADAREPIKRPVMLFVAGNSFTGDGDGPQVSSPLEQAMCFAAGNGMVAVRMSYRSAKVAPWPAGARDVAAAISWVHQNIDLFGGDAQEIIPIGYAAGAFHVASLLAHKELQDSDSDVAGAVLVSGIYRPGADGDDSEHAYFGNDDKK